jgi:O-antigen/teichoic acid export membrane protein
MTNAKSAAGGSAESVQAAEQSVITQTVDAGRDVGGQESVADMSFVARGGTLNLVGAVVSGIFTFAFYVLLAHGLDPAGVGAFMVATAVSMMVATSLQLGAQVGFVRFIPRFRVLERGDDVRPLMAIGLVPVFVLGILAASLMYSQAGWLTDLVSHGESERLVRQDLQAFAFFVPAISLMTVLVGATQGFATMRPSVIVDKIGRTGLQILGGALAVLFASSLAFVAAWGLPYVLAALVAGWWLALIVKKRTHRASRVSRARHLQLAREFWAFSAPRGVASVFQVLVMWLDTVLIAVLGTTAQAGIYAVAMRYLVVGTLAITALLQVLGPKISELLARRDISTLKGVYQGSVAWLMIIVWPLYLIIALGNHSLLSLFGHRYVTAGPALAIVALTMLIGTACGPVDIVLLMAGHSWYSVVNWVLALITNVGLDLWLIPKYGMTGAAIGWSASIVVRNLAAVGEVYAILKLHPFGVAFRRTALISLFSCGAIAGCVRLLLGHGVVSLVLTAAVGFGVHIALLVRFREVLRLDVFAAALKAAAAGRRLRRQGAATP